MPRTLNRLPALQKRFSQTLPVLGLQNFDTSWSQFAAIRQNHDNNALSHEQPHQAPILVHHHCTCVQRTFQLARRLLWKRPSLVISHEHLRPRPISDWSDQPAPLSLLFPFMNYSNHLPSSSWGGVYTCYLLFACNISNNRTTTTKNASSTNIIRFLARRSDGQQFIVPFITTQTQGNHL